MLYRYSEVFRTLIATADAALVGAAWLAAFLLRFETGLPFSVKTANRWDFSTASHCS